jgi:hypothetical protein
MSSSSLLQSGDYFIETNGLISNDEFYSMMLAPLLLAFFESKYSDS